MTLKPVDDLVDALSRLPTIGKKSALRLALHLIERPHDEVVRLADAIRQAKERIVTCARCFSYSEAELCPVCATPSRNRALVCVVEKASDLFAIEKSGRYHGVYHVLGGVLSPINGVTAQKLRVAELRTRVETEPVDELILGLGAGGDAEATSLYLARLFADRAVKITRLARGLPAGTDLEYVDQITLVQALNDRIDMRS